MKTRPIPVRLKPADIHNVDLVAKKLGIPRSSVIKLAIALQLKQIASGSIQMPSQGGQA